MIGMAIMVLSSCNGSGNTESSDGMFGGIPQTLEKYKQESGALTSGMDESNYKDKLAKSEELKKETIAKLEKEGEALNGKELAVSVDDNELKIESPLTWSYKSVFSNVQAVDFNLNGKIVVSKEIPLEVKVSDLSFEKDFLGKEKGLMVVKVPVHLEFLDKENNVLVTRTLGFMIANNDGEKAVLKEGTVMDTQGAGSVPVNVQMINADSARVLLDMSNILTSYPQDK